MRDDINIAECMIPMKFTLDVGSSLTEAYAMTDCSPLR